jgi:hypothetical protein
LFQNRTNTGRRESGADVDHGRARIRDGRIAQ